MECTSHDLTQRMPGAYTYRRRGLTTELFPDTFFQDAAGQTGWLPFARGTLTNKRSDFVIWDGRTIGGSGVDVVLDLGADCWLDQIVVEHVGAGAYACGLGEAWVYARGAGEARYHLVAARKPDPDGLEKTGPSLCLAGIDSRARYVRLHLEPAGRPTYSARSIGLVGVSLLGLTLEEKQAEDARPHLYPWPAEVTWGDGFVAVTEGTGIVAADEDRPAAELLREQIAERIGVDLPINAAARTGITLRRSLTTPLEAYDLHAGENGIIIEGDERGLFYGALTLLQLLQGGNGRAATRSVVVRDRPLSAIRGLHMYLPARENIGFCKRLLDVMAQLKMNTVVVEVDAGMRYRSHPEINAAWEQFASQMRDHLARGEAALTGDPLHPRHWQNSIHIELAGGSFLEQDEVRDLVLYARERHITMIPELQTLSHCYWLLLAHPELSERNDTPYPDTYCPSNPAVYPLVFDVMNEVLDVFEPPAMVIGHDEAWSVGTCAKCGNVPAAQLIADDVTRLHAHLARRDVVTWMWGDTLHPNYQAWQWVRNDIGCYFRAPDTTGLLDLVPNDVVVLNWWWGAAWAPQPDLLHLEQYLAAASLRQIFANFEGNSCVDYAGRAAQSGVVGAILPSWVANAQLEFGRNGVIHNLIASANVLGSHSYREQRERTWQEVAARLPRVRAYLQGHTSPLAEPGARFNPVFLDNYVNAPLADATGDLGEYDLRGIPGGDMPFSHIPFHVTDPAAAGGRAAVVVQAEAAEGHVYPAAVTGIKINRCPASLVFLHTASSSADAVQDWQYCDSPQFMARPPASRQTVGRYRVHYEDGTIEDLDLRYDEHLTRWNTRYGERAIMPYWADPAWQGTTRSGSPVTVWQYEWNNVRRKPIACVDLLAAAATDCAVILLAITVVESKENTASGDPIVQRPLLSGH